MNISTLIKQGINEKGRWQSVLKLILSLGLIGIVLYLIDFQEVINLTINSNPWYLLAVIVLFYFNRVLMAYKWGLLLQAVGVRVPLPLLFRMYIIAPLSGILLPSDLGGDVFRLYSLSKYKIDSGTLFASMVVERFLALIATLLLASISLVLASTLIHDSSIYLTGIAWSLAGLALIVIVMIGAMNSIFQGWTDRLFKRFKEYRVVGTVVGKIHHIYILCCEYRNHLRTVTIVAAWSFLEQLTPIVWHFFIARAFHINVSLLEMIAIVPIIVLAVRLPISLNSPGVQEGLYVALFGLIGVSPSEAFLLSTTGRILVLLSSLPWGVHYLMRDHQKQQAVPLNALDKSSLP